MTLPVIRLTGPPDAQGEQHGRALRDRIRRNVAVYFDRFEREGRVGREVVLGRVGQYRDAIRAGSPAYFAGMQGVAAGSGCSLDEIVALNVRYEILYYQFGMNAVADQAAGLIPVGAGRPEPDGCTAFAVLPEATTSGHLLMGQNWDWIPEVQGAIMHTTDEDGLQTVAFTEAGIVGAKIGLNSAGLGLAINGLTTTDDDWSRLSKPFHVRCYEVLRQTSIDAAQAVITGADRSCSTNFLLAQAPDRVVDVEAAPDKVSLLGCEGGCVVHTNHFVDPDRLGVVEPPSETRPHSYNRLARMRNLLATGGPVTQDALPTYLRDHDDHPYGICRHIDPDLPPEEHYITVTSAIMDLHARTLRLTDGNPCVNPYQEVALA